MVIRALALVGVGNSFAGGVVLGLIVILGADQLGLTVDDGQSDCCTSSLTGRPFPATRSPNHHLGRGQP